MLLLRDISYGNGISRNKQEYITDLLYIYMERMSQNECSLNHELDPNPFIINANYGFYRPFYSQKSH